MHTEKKYKLKFLVGHLTFVVFINICILNWSCSSSENTNGITVNKPLVKVGVMTWAGIGPAYVGVAKGFFEGIEVQLRLMDDTKARQAALASDDISMMITTIDQHTRETEQGLPGKLFLISDVSSGADGIVVRNNIKSLKELKGKRIAYTVGTASDYMLAKALEKGGLTRDDVKLRSVDDPGLASAAFNSGQVDAAVSWEPLMSKIVSEGKGRILITSADLPGTIVGIFTAKDKVTNAPIGEKFLNGWFKAISYIKSNPDESNEIMAKGMSVSVDEIKGMLEGLKLQDKSGNADFFCKNADQKSLLESLLRDSSLFWKNSGSLKEIPVLEERIAPESLKYFCSGN